MSVSKKIKNNQLNQNHPKYKIGSRCATGQEIDTILGQSSKVCVFTTRDNHLRWEYFHNQGNTPDWMNLGIEEFNELMVEISSIRSQRARSQLYVQLGKALYTTLNTDDKNELSNHFHKTRSNIQGIAKEKAKVEYVIYSMLICFIFCLFSILAVKYLFETDETTRLYIKGSIFGGLGALFSILLRHDNINVSTFSSTKFILFQAIIRMFTGIGAGVLLVLCVKANLLFGAVRSDPVVISALSIFAGFGERFIPEFIQTSNGILSK